MSVFTPYHWRSDEDLPLSEYEVKAVAAGLRFVAGVDEAGRGPLAGPIVAAAVMLSAPIEGVKDSKQLTAKKREGLYELILSGDHVVGVSIIEAWDIDAMGLQQANYASMIRAAEQLAPAPEILLVDGFSVSGCRFKQRRIVKGDRLSQSIAAASIVAKVTRDRIMVKLDERYPEYGFARHKGYGTKVHLEAINQYGPCVVHRQSFAPIARVQQTGPLL